VELLLEPAESSGAKSKVETRDNNKSKNFSCTAHERHLWMLWGPPHPTNDIERQVVAACQNNKTEVWIKKATTTRSKQAHMTRCT